VESRRRPLPDTTQHSQETRIHAPSGFEPAIPAIEWPQKHALDSATVGIGLMNQCSDEIIIQHSNSGYDTRLLNHKGVCLVGSLGVILDCLYIWKNTLISEHHLENMYILTHFNDVQVEK
jgi:hypothetical protein